MINVLEPQRLLPTTGLERRLSMCAHCPAARGAAYAILVGGRQKLVSYRCPICGHTWQQSVPDAPMRLSEE